MIFQNEMCVTLLLHAGEMSVREPADNGFGSGISKLFRKNQKDNTKISNNQSQQA